MIDIDAKIDEALPEYKNALQAEKETYARIHETTKGPHGERAGASMIRR